MSSKPLFGLYAHTRRWFLTMAYLTVAGPSASTDYFSESYFEGWLSPQRSHPGNMVINMELTQQTEEVKRNLQVYDFICCRCRVQATCDNDHICGICKAMGKTSGPKTENMQWHILLNTLFTREAYFWSRGRKPYKSV